MTPHQRDLANRFYGSIDAWRAGEITLRDVMDENPSSYIRGQIIEATSPYHPLFGDIMKFLDAEIAMTRGPGIQTRHGWFTEEELASYGGKIVEVVDEESGLIEEAIAWPTQYEIGIDGKPNKDRPIYGKKPSTRPEQNPLFIRRRPNGYDLWNDPDLTQLDGIE